ncbi:MULTISPECIES: 3-hydroxyacyl-CoA dehydrogenase [Gordonia]|uniref:3-hydroxybutyryl-CoA dehydrogenase n=1 Tax=Gordonia sputi NBRC 100414 TaxID=1089453 RepID=H5U0I1_9ACTN|nr:MULTISPECIES: 3-hydroxyacyl-CoA dehydrogenase [Gordonia]NKY93343.1 3-hydroxyacyl-CoA dehydrogenase [Gordonia sputi]OBA33943.1 3-hydroxybutyryl-CoA dehydrogenase [Gordonia sp. 852002-51296_SCH5728562-b]GAB39239.1 3-hydroxybutyryl-CoA dehydrogenase [Gordonia sputi NBRC 100414]
MAEFSTVTVLGAGVLGSQIAFQTAYKGIDVTSYDINQQALDAASKRYDELVETYKREVPGAADGAAEAARKRITLTDDLAKAAQSQLIIEAVPEILELKQDTYRKLNELAPKDTVFATNSSSLLPSDLESSTGRPDKFLALHFANRVWQFNTAEIMGTKDTDPAVYDKVVKFADEIGMVPIQIHKEKAGYVLNSLLIPFLNAALELAAGGYADPQDVDKTWRIATGSPLGPFQIYDVVGLMTPYNILMNGDQGNRHLGAWLKQNYIDKGKLGMASGEGFYTYPKQEQPA